MLPSRRSTNDTTRVVGHDQPFSSADGAKSAIRTPVTMPSQYPPSIRSVMTLTAGGRLVKHPDTFGMREQLSCQNVCSNGNVHSRITSLTNAHAAGRLPPTPERLTTPAKSKRCARRLTATRIAARGDLDAPYPLLVEQAIGSDAAKC